MAKEYVIREDVINDIGELFTICRETLPNECGHHFIVESELQSHLDFVRNLHAADVVEVVRCCECVYHDDESQYHYCRKWRRNCPNDSDFFCKWGKRKDGGQDNG